MSEQASTRPLVTVLVISYNYERFLPEAVDGALGQTYPRVEVVVVDDGSTDGTAQVLARFGDRVRFCTAPNAGQAAAVNRGLRLARGELVVILDADDVLLPDVVERAVRAFEADQACVRVQFRLLECDEAGNPTGGTVPPRSWPLMQGDVRPHVLRHRLFRSPPTSGNMWRTSTLLDLPPVPVDTFRSYPDRWYSELTALVGRIAALDEPGGKYRLHGGNHHVGVGKGLEYFSTRVALTRELHEAGRQVAQRAGVTGYPGSVDDREDAAFLAWRVVERRLGPGRPRGRGTARLALRASRAALRQPGPPLRSRVGRAAWVVAVAGVPRRYGLMERLVAARYDRGTH